MKRILPQINKKEMETQRRGKAVSVNICALTKKNIKSVNKIRENSNCCKSGRSLNRQSKKKKKAYCINSGSAASIRSNYIY